MYIIILISLKSLRLITNALYLTHTKAKGAMVQLSKVIKMAQYITMQITR